MLNRAAGATTCETATEQGENPSTDTRQQHNHLLQVHKCPGGGRALGFGVSGLGVVLFYFLAFKNSSINSLWYSRLFPTLLAILSLSILRTWS